MFIFSFGAFYTHLWPETRDYTYLILPTFCIFRSMGTPWVVLAPLCRVVHCRQRMRSCGSVINDCQVFEEKILANTDIKMQIMTIWHEKYYNKTARRHQSAAVCVNNCVIIWTQTPASFIWLDKHHPSSFRISSRVVCKLAAVSWSLSISGWSSGNSSSCYQ